MSSNINSIIKQSQNHLSSNIKRQSNILGQELVKEAKSSMNDAKTGRVYRIGKVFHTASATGEPLANITGSPRDKFPSSPTLLLANKIGFEG